MNRQDLITNIVETAVGGKTIGFYDSIERDTRALLHHKDDNSAEILLVRAGPRRTAVHADRVCEQLLINGFTVSTPISVVNRFGKWVVEGTGQRLIVTDPYESMLIAA